MSYGPKADNLIYLRQHYPAHVPAFELLTFEDAIEDHAKVHRRITKLVEGILQSKTSSERSKAKLRAISESVSLNSQTVASFAEQIAAHDWEKVSIRTSARSEDGDSLSFAGQYASFVDLTHSIGTLEAHIVRCFQSLFTERVIEYAKVRGVTSLDIGGAVIVQEMFYGKKSGVMFTENGRGQIEFAIADSWRNTIVEGEDATKVLVPKTTLQATGVTRQLTSIAQIGIELEEAFAAPVDVEWAYDSEQVMLLQVRPQTTDTTTHTLSWDATNISESYPGVTLPLTYSFIRGLYSQVYPSFFRLMGMSERKLKKNEWIFNNALGYINGRVYYRIENWYELVSLIPGLKNQDFFEAMLKPVKKKGPAKKSFSLRTLLKPSLIILSLRFGWLLVRSRAYSKSFSKHFMRKYKQYGQLNWSAMSADAIYTHLHEIRREMLVLWGTPILNDVRVMIFHGIFKTIILKGADTQTYLSHLSGLSDRASIKPLQALQKLGSDLDQAMKREGATNIERLAETASWAGMEAKASSFIATYGGRTPDELKLENPRLGENLLDVLQLAYASRDTDLSLLSTASRPSLGNIPTIKRLFFPFIARQMREAIDYRERFRFNRAQIFGLARTAYLALGERLAEAQVIETAEDVFYLTEEEVSTVVNAHSWMYNHKKLVTERRRQYKTYDAMPLWLRTSGHGPIAATSLQDTSAVSTTPGDIAGEGVAPGRVSGQVIVVDEFDPRLDVTGKILVVRHIDPGWTLLLVQAAGVITERGNALSHVAIVSREICVPAIVGARGVVSTLKTGETVTIDGTTGEILRES